MGWNCRCLSVALINILSILGILRGCSQDKALNGSRSLILAAQQVGRPVDSLEAKRNQSLLPAVTELDLELLGSQAILGAAVSCSVA